MSLTLVTPPLEEPLTLAEVKAHLRVDDALDDDDTYITLLISVVRQRCEAATRRTLITQTWDVYLDTWPTWNGYHGGYVNQPASSLLPAGGFVMLPKPPLQSVTYVKYVDMAGTLQTWAATEYRVDASAGDRCARGRLALGWVKVWPIVQPIMNAIQIRIVTGYGATGVRVPAILRQAMLLDAGTLYETRESVTTDGRASMHVPATTRDIYRSFRSL